MEISKLRQIVGQKLRQIILVCLQGELNPKVDIKKDAVYTGGGVKMVFDSETVFFCAKQVDGRDLGYELEISGDVDSFLTKKIEFFDLSSTVYYSMFIHKTVSKTEPRIDDNLVQDITFYFDSCEKYLEISLSDGFCKTDSDDILIHILDAKS